MTDAERQIADLQEANSAYLLRARTAEAEADTLRKALYPFANTYREVMKFWPNVFVMVQAADEGAPFFFSSATVGDFARAAELDGRVGEARE